jgi:hypothetical protein
MMPYMDDVLSRRAEAGFFVVLAVIASPFWIPAVLMYLIFAGIGWLLGVK